MTSFVNAKGQPMTEVPLVMMAATKIGERQGSELWAEMKKRGWKLADSGVLAITANELDTARRAHRRFDGRSEEGRLPGFADLYGADQEQ